MKGCHSNLIKVGRNKTLKRLHILKLIIYFICNQSNIGRALLGAKIGMMYTKVAQFRLQWVTMHVEYLFFLFFYW